MSIKKIILSLFVVTVLFSCKDKDAKKDKKDTFFTVTLNITSKIDDGFQVFYKEVNDDTVPFEESSVVNVNFKGGDQPQDLVFNLPANTIPTNLRIDLGNNKSTKEIIVNDFKMTYNDKTFDAKGVAFFNYFLPDEKLIKFDKAASKVLPLTTETGYYDPMVFSNDLLDAEIQKLVK